MEEDEIEPHPKILRIDSSSESGEESKKQVVEKQKGESKIVNRLIPEKSIISITQILGANKPNVILYSKLA